MDDQSHLYKNLMRGQKRRKMLRKLFNDWEHTLIFVSALAFLSLILIINMGEL
jgi:hypothetical protein